MFLTVIKPVALTYVCSYLTGLHNGKYCVELVVNLPIVLRRLFLDFLAILNNLSDSIIFDQKYAKCLIHLFKLPPA